MTSNLQLIKSAEFNGIQFDCYAQDKQQNTSDFWATREQIGKLLEYEYPREAIGKIHERNKERLDKFSSEVKLTTEAGQRIAMIYNFKGLLEICRYSNQPKADAVMDFLWEIADEIRRTGSYSVHKQFDLPFNIFESAKFILNDAGITGNQCTLALDKLYKSYTGKSLLLTAGIELEAPVKEQPLTPTEIAEILGIGEGKKGAHIVNTLLFNAGYQRQIGEKHKKWEPTELGKPYAYMADVSKNNSIGSPTVQLKWYSSILDVVKKLVQEMSKAMNLAKIV